MNMILTRTDYEHDGIFGKLESEDGQNSFITLEHAYDSGHGDGSYAPKVPEGSYTCVRGEHQLAHMKAPFTTFEITGVPGHSNILFHVGNFNNDSEGCVLLGLQQQMAPYSVKMLTNSREAFNKFMELQQGVDTFTVTIKKGQS